MEAKKQNGPQPKVKKERNQVVNEQDQLEKINPDDGEYQSAGEKNSDNSGNSSNKSDQPGLFENQAGLEEGNTYEDDPKRGENKMPVN